MSTSSTHGKLRHGLYQGNGEWVGGNQENGLKILRGEPTG